MAYFKPIRNIYSFPEVYDDVIIGNSETITTGGLVNISGGFADAAAAGEPVYGVAVGFVASLKPNRGLPLDKLSAATDYDGTYTTGAFGTNAYVASADNQTDKKIAVRVRMDIGMVMTNEPDAALATTTGSNLKGYFTDIAGPTQVDESTAHTSTVSQLMVLGVGGDLLYEDVPTTHGIYTIFEKQERSR